MSLSRTTYEAGRGDATTLRSLRVTDTAECVRSKRTQAVLWAIPIVVGLLGFAVGYAVASSRPDRFEHRLTLISAQDGRIGLRDNRDLTYEFLSAELASNPAGDGIDVDLESRFNSALDIIVTAGSQSEASTVARHLGATAVEHRTEASLERFISEIAANGIAISELDVKISDLEGEISGLGDDDTTGRSRLERDRTALADTRNELKAQIATAETRMDASVPPLRLSSSIAQGNTAEPRRTASLVGAAAAMLALLVIAATTFRRP